MIFPKFVKYDLCKYLLFLVCFAISYSTFYYQYHIYDNIHTLYLLSKTIIIGGALIYLYLLFFLEIKYYALDIIDILFVSIICCILLNYDFNLQFSEWKIKIALLMLPLWFILRLAIHNIPAFKNAIVNAILAIGCIQAIYGLFQLYGLIHSNHNIFPMTGLFHNPGPYTGYIGIILPLCLYKCLIEKRKIVKSILIFILIILFSIIPAGMSRTAWIGIILSCTWILAVDNNWGHKISNIIKSNRNLFWGYTCIGIFCLIIILLFFFMIKKDSANGRFFIWKNTMSLVMENPWNGHGIGEFPYIYGKKQAEYFSDHSFSAVEEKVAGSPEYAFNDYLQLAVETGIIGLVLFLLLIFYSVKRGVKNREYGFVGCIISLSIFSFGSYPFQMSSFWVIGIFFLAGCTTSKNNRKIIKNRWKTKSLIILSFLFIIILDNKITDYHSIMNHWDKAQLLINHDGFLAADACYKKILTNYRHNSFFLFEYAKNLIKLEKYKEANDILKQATKLSCDPMIYNVMGQNYQKMKQYKNAESCYQYAVNLLPGRIYPYYLLTKLYAEPNFLHKEKAERMANIVLTKQPKIESKAIEEMRSDVRKLLRDLHNINQ